MRWREARFWTEMIMDDRALKSNAKKLSLLLLTVTLVASAQAGNNNNNNNTHVSRSAGSNSGAYHNAYLSKPPSIDRRQATTPT
jgi:hypothetical protein